MTSPTLIWDIETDGLLKKLTRITCLVIRDADTRETFRFRKREASPAYECHPITQPGVLTAVEAEDTIADGIAMLEAGGQLVGHNVIGFDVPAVRKIFPTFRPTGVVRDTLVLTRVIMPDTSDGDIPLWKAGRLPGKLFKSHSLDAWGFRTGRHKGNYAEQMEALGKNPWASWNADLEDYCVNDVDVTEVLWAAVQSAMPAESAVELEHDVHDLCAVLERNGFPFDVGGALELKGNLQSEYDHVAGLVKAEFGPWFAPEKKRRVAVEWFDPEGANEAQYTLDMRPDVAGEEPRKRKYYPARPEFGEDYSRHTWGEVTVPKKEMKFRTQVPRELCAPGFTHAFRSPDAPYCKIELKDFNPGSRHHVIDRLQQAYNWVPKEFTDKGNPEVNDGVLKGLVKEIPIAEKIAECFFIKKYLGQIADGQQSWLKSVDAETGCIHCYINVGGTVTGRCSHVGPNLGQVPSVAEAPILSDAAAKRVKAFMSEVEKEVFLRSILNDKAHVLTNFNPAFVDAKTSALFPYCFKPDGSLKKEAALRGRPGEWGWECRSLFGVPPEWLQVGIDLSGIEFRCLAELMAMFDNGELIDVIMSGQDIHVFNMMKTGITSRNIIKRCLYGLMYGAGDYKLGITADEGLTSFEAEATRLGKEIRGQIMAGLPALKQAIDLVKREAGSGYLIGLDGRKLGCRNEYSALNLRLQSNAALIAKKWLVLTERNALKRGWDHGWFSGNNPDGLGDFAMMAFVHDEQQSAVRPDLSKEFARVGEDAAGEAGKFFNFRCPIEAKHKIGRNWAECH